jgi:sugar-specific transcriptional regulator TrmB
MRALQELGLTSRQAKIYQLLLKNGGQKARTISRTINADRGNVYQTLFQLQKKGLLKKILAKPTLYEAVPLQDAVTNILEHKKKQYQKLSEHAQELLLSNSINKMCSQKGMEEFSIVKFGKELHLKKIADTCDTAEERVDLLLNKKYFFNGLINHYEPYMEALKRGVKYRVIIEHTNPKPVLKILQTLMSEPNFQIKHVPDKLKTAGFGIKDEKCIGISLLSNVGIGESPILVTINPGFLEIFQSFFDNMWNRAQEYKPQ